MQITLEIPDDLAAHLIATGQDPMRAALESMAVDGYRLRRLNEFQVKQMLGFTSRMQVHALLKQHDVPLDYSIDDFEHDLQVAAKFKRHAGSNQSA
jgi:hypothetical protein